MDQDRLREITQALESGTDEQREFALIELREERATLRERNQAWGQDLMTPSPGSGRVPAALDPGDMLRKRVETLINFIMAPADEMEGTRLMFEIRYQHALLEMHRQLEDAATAEYQRQTKPKLELPGNLNLNTRHKN